MACCAPVSLFSAIVPYIPVAAPAEYQYREDHREPETFDILEWIRRMRETEETTAEIDPDAPAPYKLNLANM